MGPGSRPERDVVPARRVDDRGDGRRRAYRAAGALLRVLAAAPPGRLRGRSATLGRRAAVSAGSPRFEPGCDVACRGFAPGVERTRGRAPLVDRDAPGEGLEVGSCPAGDAT